MNQKQNPEIEQKLERGKERLYRKKGEGLTTAEQSSVFGINLFVIVQLNGSNV